GRIKLSYCNTENQIADVLTKPLKIDKFKDTRKMLNVFSMPLKIVKFKDTRKMLNVFSIESLN
ncbi:hypothetical protein L195_g062150, partial [Trifolium pratense]